VEIWELPDWRRDEGCVEERELPPPDAAAASALAFAWLKLFRLLSRCPKGNVGITVLFSAAPPRRYVTTSLDFPADIALFGDPSRDFAPPEPADDDRGFTFSAMAPVD
jgi:hypothetical protein